MLERLSRGTDRTRTFAERLLLSALVAGVLGGAVSFGVLAAFSATSSNSGNEITAGDVRIGDNDSGAALYNASGLAPGAAVNSCIKVTYTGSLAASVRIYANGSPGPLAQYIDLTITEGTQPSAAFPSCNGFVPASGGGQRFNGTLQQFEQNHSGYGSAIETAPANWTPGAARVYRVTATLRANTPDSAQGLSSGAHSFVWEARSN